jgi:hypothetical protein
VIGERTVWLAEDAQDRLRQRSCALEQARLTADFVGVE